MVIFNRSELMRMFPDSVSMHGLAPEVLSAFTDTARLDHADNIARVLFENEATAIYHLDPDRIRSSWFPGPDPDEDIEIDFLQPKLLAVNYRGGAHSEARDACFVQDVVAERGPWVVRGNETKFYLEDPGLPQFTGPEYKHEPDNPSKMQNKLYTDGDPYAVFGELAALGYTFSDEPRTKQLF